MESKSEVSVDAKQKLIKEYISQRYNSVPSRFNKYKIDELMMANKESFKINEKQISQFLFNSPIEELGFDQTSYDMNGNKSYLEAHLLIEIKQFRNISKPYQRAEIDAEEVQLNKDKLDKGAKKKPKGSNYMLIAHDGVRFMKLSLLFSGQEKFVSNINEANKYLVRDCYCSNTDGAIVLLIDSQDQISQLYNDTKTPKLQESFTQIQGLPIKYTAAPRFKFFNEKNQGKSGGKGDDMCDVEEQQDEFQDLFKHHDVTDLTAQERTYIKRLENLGFWRKKFD